MAGGVLVRVLSLCGPAAGGMGRVAAWLAAGRAGADGPPDVIEAHGWRAGWAARRLARRWSAPLVVIAHGYPPPGPRSLALTLLEAGLRPLPAAYVAVSTPLADWLRPRLRVPVHVIPLVPPCRPLARAEARDLLGLDAGGRVVGCVGRLAWEKGCDVLLEAWSRLPRSLRAPWRLCVVGDGPLARPLRRQARLLGIEQEVTWTGAVADAGRLISAFDVYVQPSRREGLGLAALEAAAAGVPAVLSAAGGLAELAAAAAAAVRPGDAPALAAALAGVMGLDDRERRRAGARFRDAARRRFPAGSGAAALDDLYRRLVQGRRRWRP